MALTLGLNTISTKKNYKQGHNKEPKNVGQVTCYNWNKKSRYAKSCIKSKKVVILSTIYISITMSPEALQMVSGI